MTEQTIEQTETPKKRGWPKGRPRKPKSMEPTVEAAAPERHQGHYDRQAAFNDVRQTYQVVNHTRDAIKVIGQKGATMVIVYRRSTARDGTVIEHQLSDFAAKRIADILNEETARLKS